MVKPSYINVSENWGDQDKTFQKCQHPQALYYQSALTILCYMNWKNIFMHLKRLVTRNDVQIKFELLQLMSLEVI